MEVTPGEVPDRMRVPGDDRAAASSLAAGRSFLRRIVPVESRPAVNRLAGDSALADNSSVAQITLHPALTGGIGSGGRPGDEGLLVVVEPRDFGGNIVNAPGDISVALLDPALTGEQARLARWDFAAARDPRDDPHGLATGDSPAIALEFHAGPQPVEGFCPLYDPRWAETPGRAAPLISVALNDPPPARREALPMPPPGRRPPGHNGRNGRP